MPDIDPFLTELAAATPLPAGGSVAALQVAMAAALVEMVAGLTLPRKQDAQARQTLQRLADQAHMLRRRVAELARADVAAYGAVIDALALPRGTDEQREERRRRVQAALQGAAVPPLRTMQAATEVIALAAELVEVANRSILSDVGAAIVAARAGYDTGQLNVDTNAARVDDAAWRAEIERALDEVPNPDVAQRVAMQRVRDAIRSVPR